MAKDTVKSTNERVDNMEMQLVNLSTLIGDFIQSMQPTEPTTTKATATVESTATATVSPELAKARENNLYHSTIEKNANTVYFSVDRDWTWCIFDTKPCENTRNVLKNVYSFRYSRKRVAWYAPTAYNESSMQAIAKAMQPTATLKKNLAK